MEKEVYLRSNIAAARVVLLSWHRIPLKEFTTLRKKPENRGGLYPVWGIPWVQPPSRPSDDEAERLFWTWVELSETHTLHDIAVMKKEDSWETILEQRDLRIEFAHLIGKRQLNSELTRLRLRYNPPARVERGYDVSGDMYFPPIVRLRNRALHTRLPRLFPRRDNRWAVNPEPVNRLPCTMALRVAPPLHEKLDMAVPAPLTEHMLNVVVRMAMAI